MITGGNGHGRLKSEGIDPIAKLGWETKESGLLMVAHSTIRVVSSGAVGYGSLDLHGVSLLAGEFHTR